METKVEVKDNKSGDEFDVEMKDSDEIKDESKRSDTDMQLEDGEQPEREIEREKSDEKEDSKAGDCQCNFFRRETFVFS